MEYNEKIYNLELDNNKKDLELSAKLQAKKNKIRKELAELGLLKKDAKNDFDKYQYFSEAQHKALFTKLFSKNGIEVKISEAGFKEFQGSNKQPFGRFVTLECSLIDVDTGYKETSFHTGEGLDKTDKAIYKATTGAIKRFLSTTFLVATQDDPEIDNNKSVVTDKQVKYLYNLWENNKEEFMKIMAEIGKSKIQELNMQEANIIIKKLGAKNDK